jgi:hypothetical protein
MDLLIKTTGITDLTLAAVTSATDLTPLVGPDDFPQLVLGSTEPITLKFLTAASTYASFTADPTYRMIVSLGLVTADGLENYAETELLTAISDGKSGNLALTSTALIDAVECAFAGNWRASTVQLTLQVTVTDPSGYRRAYAMLPVTLWGRVPSFTPDNTPLPSQIFTRAFGFNTQINSIGNTTVTPASTVPFHTEQITFTGSARTSVVIMSETGRAPGDVIMIKLIMPTTPGITAELRTASSVGTLLASVTSAANGRDYLLGPFVYQT